MTDEQKKALAAAVQAMEAAAYEFICLEPRTSGGFQKNIRANKENLNAAVTDLKARFAEELK